MNAATITEYACLTCPRASRLDEAAARAHLDLVHGVAWSAVRWLEESRYCLPDGIYAQAFGWLGADACMLRDERPACERASEDVRT
jgi:hypothetical protein